MPSHSNLYEGRHKHSHVAREGGERDSQTMAVKLVRQHSGRHAGPQQHCRRRRALSLVLILFVIRVGVGVERGMRVPAIFFSVFQREDVRGEPGHLGQRLAKVARVVRVARAVGSVPFCARQGERADGGRAT
jgi:hypothetical protein